MKFSLKEFRQEYGTHEQCLEVIKRLRFSDLMECPKCKGKEKFYTVKGRTAYACNNCGHHIYPLAGTIFEKTTTPLDLWFFAMYLMTQTRSGTSAKQLERMLGVTYKTAWRMFKQIRMLMVNTIGTESSGGNGELLDGTVEIDETFIGGKGKNRAFKPNFNEIPKEVVMGMVQRNEQDKNGTDTGGNKVYLKHIPNTGKWTLLEQIKNHVDAKARVITDEYYGYTQLKYHCYKHDFVKHKETYVVGDIYTQNVENLWSILKRGIYGVYRVVSKKYLQAYIDEYSWRYNNRKYQDKMFEKLLSEIANIKVISQVKVA
ncbi:MAG: IS1595 family transposase [Patescibacteria group bacterium]|nr:IS1595 family transposase [Patescibacteria group bacterium]